LPNPRVIKLKFTAHDRSSPVLKAIPVEAYYRPRGFQEVEAARF
jgi:hypothetical protein